MSGLSSLPRHLQRRVKNEDRLSCDCAEILATAFPVGFSQVSWGHIANEHAGSKVNGMISAAMGKRGGIADFVIWWTPEHQVEGNNLAFAELKYGKNGLTDSQKQFEEECDSRPTPHVVVRSTRDMVRFLINLGLQPFTRIPLEQLL